MIISINKGNPKATKYIYSKQWRNQKRVGGKAKIIRKNILKNFGGGGRFNRSLLLFRH